MISFDEECGEVYVETFLNHYLPLWQRIKTAVKYAFGHKSPWGAYDCTIFKDNDVPKLISLLERARRITEQPQNNATGAQG